MRLASRPARFFLATCAAMVALGAAAITGGMVHSGFLGEWVPGTATCSSPLKLAITEKSVVFSRGADRAEFTRLEQCFSCAGQGAQGITMLSTDAMGDSPFMITLDESRSKRPVMTVDLGNDKKLAGRFPFGSQALKRCR